MFGTKNICNIMPSFPSKNLFHLILINVKNMQNSFSDLRNSSISKTKEASLTNNKI